MTTHTQRKQLLALALIGITPFTLNGLVNSFIADDALLYWGFEGLTWVVIPAAIAWQATRIQGFSFSGLGYHCSIRGRNDVGLLMLACALFAPLCYGVYTGLYDLFSNILPENSVFTYDSIEPESLLSSYLVVIYFGFSAGLVEEFLYRGLLLRAFSGLKHATLLFLLLSPLLFSLVHWEDGLANLASTWFFGLFMATAYLWLRNLWPLVIGHIVTDLVLFA